MDGKRIMWGVSMALLPTPSFVIKETDKFYRVKCRITNRNRMIKKGNIFETFEECKTECMRRASLIIRNAEAELQRAKDKKQKINNMKQPEVPEWMK